MLLRNILTIISVLLAFSLSPVIIAETNQTIYSADISLSSLTQYVYEHHTAHHRDEAQQQRIDANSTLANAQFSDVSRINLQHQNDLIGSDDGLQEWEASIEMQLWKSGQQQRQQTLSQQMIAELPSYQKKIQLDASAKVRQHVWAVVLLDSQTQYTLQRWQSAQTLEQDVLRKIDAGELAETEALLANSHVIEMHNQYIQTSLDLNYALLVYSKLSNESRLPQDYSETVSDDVVISHQHPLLKVLEQQINTLRVQQDIVGFDRSANSNLSFGIRSERGERGEHFNNSIGVGFNFALDDKVYRQADIANVANDIADLEIEWQDLEIKLGFILSQQRHNLESKQQQIKLVIKQDLQMQKYLALQQSAFELGEIDLVNVLQSQSIADQVHNQRQNLAIEIKQTIANINQSLGIIL